VKEIEAESSSARTNEDNKKSKKSDEPKTPKKDAPVDQSNKLFHHLCKC